MGESENTMNNTIKKTASADYTNDNIFSKMSKNIEFGTSMFSEISPEITENDHREMIISLVREGKIGADTIGAILDARKAYEEKAEKEHSIHNHLHNICQNNSGYISDMLGAVNSFNDIGFNVRIVEKENWLLSIPTDKFTIVVTVGGYTKGGVHWNPTFVEIPAELLDTCFKQAIDKYGRPLLGHILEVYHLGGRFFEGKISTEEVVARGDRLVATLRMHGWNSAMSEFEFEKWLDHQPAGWLAVVIRAILSGGTGHITCSNCAHAIFDNSGYVRCRKCKFEVPIRDNKFDKYIEFARRKEVCRDIVLSDVVRDVTHDCSVKRAVTRMEACRLQKVARKYNK